MEIARRVEEPGPTGSPFDAQAAFWNAVYHGHDVFSAIHQRRHAVALGWVERLALPPGASALDLGCGSGVMSVALAQKGFSVLAVDLAGAMIELTRRHAIEAGVEDRVVARLGDIYTAELDREAFSLVTALGLIPWLHSTSPALRRMAQVLRPDGWAVVNCDIRARLHYFLDPLYNPYLEPLRRGVRRLLQPVGLRRAADNQKQTRMHGRREFDRLLASAGLARVDSYSFGFGPFSFFGRTLLPNRVGLLVDQKLQSLADGGIPCMRSVAAQYLVLARKC